MLRLVKGYTWKGFTRLGKPISGVQLGRPLNIIRAQLQQQQISVIQFRSVWRVALEYRTISAVEIGQFSRQLAHILKAGFALVPALECLLDQYPTRSPMHGVLLDLKLALENGMSLSDALRQYPCYFTQLYCYLIEVSEQCGTLVEQLIQLANYYERLAAIRRDVIKALYYPMSVLSVSCGIILLLFIFVIPQFEELFHTVGATLPPLTCLLINTARFLKSYGLIVGFSIISLGSILMLLTSKVQFCNPLQDLVLKLPWIGSIVQRAMVARFAYTLSTTLRAGLPILEALKIAQEIMYYETYKKALLKASEAIMNGSPLDKALLYTRCFPRLLIHMVAVGHSSGDLENNLLKLAHLLENEVSESIKRMISFLEPMLLLILGMIIGTLTLALYWPMFELGNVVALA